MKTFDISGNPGTALSERNPMFPGAGQVACAFPADHRDVKLRADWRRPRKSTGYLAPRYAQIALQSQVMKQIVVPQPVVGVRSLT